MDKLKPLSKGQLGELGFEDVTTSAQKFGNALKKACRLAERGAVGTIRRGTNLAIAAAIVTTVLTQSCIEPKEFHWPWGELVTHADTDSAGEDASDVHSAGGDGGYGGDGGGDPPDVVEVISPDDTQEVIDQQGIDAVWQDLQDLVDAGVVDIPDIQQDLKDALEDLPLETTAPDILPDVQPEIVEEIVEPDVPPPDCNDNNPCTEDEFLEDLQDCEYTYNSNPCSYLDDLCALESMCQEGLCVPTDWIDCNDGNECTNNFCHPETGECEDTNNENPCDDENPCTLDDQCAEGVCEGAEKNCQEETGVDNSACNELGGCSLTMGCETGSEDPTYRWYITVSNGSVESWKAKICSTCDTWTGGETILGEGVHSYECKCSDHLCAIAIKPMQENVQIEVYAERIDENGVVSPYPFMYSKSFCLKDLGIGSIEGLETIILPFMDEANDVTIATSVGPENTCMSFLSPTYED
ncbi:hypothetical protein HOG17_00505 [Candidatus Peregrinibacteria bacterium]|jgi:hypothetical protein|nr:hypothetical protein [Candidatus Peregrinibacteria bacterium]MBT4148666.1 hypothetical protein [Candidatus Peregrinibacteria bacterium]MBT4456003.1 hypothetical protein [Candidatus Peregrinibacteria bacterium]